MKYNPDVHHRKSIRIKEYNYSKEGMYFITICVQNKKCILGDIIEQKLNLNKYGKIVEEEIINTYKIRKNIEINNYIIMPNHVHMIIEIHPVGVACYATQKNEPECMGKKSTMLIPQIIQQIKTITIKRTKKYNEENLGIGLHTMQPLQWQKNYYEHIIRNEKELYKIQEYIKYNHLNWDQDKYNKY